MSTSYEFVAEYAKSGRATCKGCQRIITKGALRIGVKTVIDGAEPDERRDAPKWYHAKGKCVGQFRKTTKWWSENCPELEDIVGSEDLKDSEQEDLEELFEGLKTGKAAASPKAKDSKKKKQEESEGESDEEGSEEEEEKPKKKKKVVKKKHQESEEDGSGSSSQSGSGSESSESEEEEKPKKKKQAIKKRKRDESESGEDGDSDEDAKPKAKKTKAAPKKSAGRKTVVDYTAESLDDDKVAAINEVIESISSKTIPQLKAMLVKNAQKTSGTKPEVLERVGELTVLGCLPKCEKCGGNLRFDKDNGTYSCAGKFEDGHMQRCSFKADSMDRTPWRA